MAELSWISLWLIGICAFLIGFSKTSIGGLGIVAGTFDRTRGSWSGIDRTLAAHSGYCRCGGSALLSSSMRLGIFLKIFPITALGVVVGYFVMDKLPRDLFGSALGGIILVMLLIGWGLEKKPVSAIGNTFLTLVVGLCAGISTMIANAAGPLLGIYLLQQGLPKNNFVGTRSVYFLMLNLFKLPFSASLGLITISSLKINVATVPVIALGALVGAQLVKKINITVFKWVIRGAATLSAFKLLIG